jgi:predicted metal-dependent hydrolase
MSASAEPATIVQGGRAKAYRPLAIDARSAAVRAGLAAYARGDCFEAHELLEPAWMGSSDIGERDLVQGLIKVAAAYVHQARGNPLGVDKNLRGARARLDAARSHDQAIADLAAIDVDALVAAIDDRLGRPGGLADPAPAISRRAAADEPSGKRSGQAPGPRASR